MQQTSARVVFLLVLLGSAAIAQQQQQQQQQQQHQPRGHCHPARPSLLPTCAKILAALPEHQICHLRDLIQLEGQAARKAFYFGELLQRKITPAKEPSEIIAFTTNLTTSEVEQHQKQAYGAFLDATLKVEEFMAKMKASLQAAGGAPASGGPYEAAARAHSSVRAGRRLEDGGGGAQDLGDWGPKGTVLRACVMGHTNPHLYEHRPRVSMLLQYFKRSHIIQPFIERMQSCREHHAIELLVNVDHPADHEAWALASYHTSGLVVPVFSNNLHEIRAYNRLTHLARGDFVVFLADDDLPPTHDNCSWIADLVTVFDRWPNVGVLGLRGYQHCYAEGERNRGPWFKDPATGLVVHWVQRVDMSPMAFRRTALLQVGGMDETLSDQGACGIISDWEVCHRMWTAGWEVMAAQPLPLEHDKTEPGGTHKPATAYKCWGLQMGTAGQVMSTHGAVSWENEMCAVARRLNLERLKLINETRCPYQAGCKLEGS